MFRVQAVFRSKSGTPLRVLNVPDRGAEMLVQGPRPPFDQSPFSADSASDYPGTSWGLSLWEGAH
jgi:hypothetical protein